ncbi:MAG: 4Fe-4S dicluster domain-containing protein [Candidatus Heimdallarchaeota archaeon]
MINYLNIHDKVGAIVVATGFKSFDPSVIPTLHYKEPGYEGVISGLEFERLTNSAGPTEGQIIIPNTDKKPKSIAFINCVGSRDKNYHEYCSRYCCTASIKHAFLLKDKYGSDMETLLFYKDIRTFGKGYEELYNRSRSKGVEYIKGVPSEIRKDVDGSLYFDVYNVDLEKTIRYRPDLIVLQTAMVPNDDAKKIGELLSCSMDKDGFFIEKHIKLAPVETASAGKFIAGACRGPIDITDSVSQGYAAAILAAKLIMSKSIEKEAIVSEVQKDVCSGCGSCVSTCVYQALSLYVDEEGHTKSQVNSILCEGCGACAATCPSNAIIMNHFTNDQIEAMIQTAFKETESPAP